MIAARQIAFGKAAGAAKPYKARLEYLESTGTQWIETGYVFDESLVFELDGAMTGDATSCGLVDSIGSGARVFLNASNSQNKFAAGIGSTQRIDGTYDTLRHKFKVGLSVGFWIDDVRLQAFGGNSTPYGASLALFRRASGGATAIIWSAKILSGENLVFNLIPVLDNNDVACMYDEVSGEFFYNQGTGEFIAGPEITEE